MQDIAAFRSGRFKPILPDACQVNPRAYGAELAFWLAGKLAREGVVTSYPVARNGAWMLEAGAALTVLCTNVGGSDEYWQLALARCEGGDGHADKVRELVNAIRFVLHAAVPAQHIDWRYPAAE